MKQSERAKLPATEIGPDDSLSDMAYTVLYSIIEEDRGFFVILPEQLGTVCSTSFNGPKRLAAPEAIVFRLKSGEIFLDLDKMPKIGKGSWERCPEGLTPLSPAEAVAAERAKWVAACLEAYRDGYDHQGWTILSQMKATQEASA